MLIRIGLSVGVALILTAGDSYSQSIVTKSTITTNGTVNSIVVDAPNNKYYIGGDFTTVGKTGPGYGVWINGTSGQPQTSFPEVDGNVLASLSDGSGGVYIGGNFHNVGNQVRNFFAHIDAAGAVSQLGSNLKLNGTITTFHKNGSTLYIGGEFTQADNSIAASSGVTLDRQSGMIETFPVVNGEVSEVISDNLGGWYIGGSFTTVGGVSRSNIAQIDQFGNVTAWNPGINGPVNVMALSGTLLHVGGNFTTPRNNFVTFDTNTGSPWVYNPMPNNEVLAIAIGPNPNTVTLAGKFTFVDGSPRNYIASFTGFNLNSTSVTPNNYISSLAVDQSTGHVYVAGSFTSISGQSRNGIACLAASSSLFPTTWNPGVTGTVKKLAVVGTTVYAAGNFTTIGGQMRNNIASLSTSSNTALAWNPNANSEVNALFYFSGGGASDPASLYVGGNFTTIGGQLRSRVASINPTTGLANHFNVTSNSAVTAMQMSDTQLYLGGNSISVTLPRTRLLALDVNTNTLLQWNPVVGNTVNAILFRNNETLVGGNFTSVNGNASINYLAGFDATTGISNNYGYGVNGEVHCLAYTNNGTIVGGNFTTLGAGGPPRNNLGELDPNLPTNATSWIPNAGGTVRTMLLSGSTLYVGGEFLGMNNDSGQRCLTAFDMTSRTLLPWISAAHSGSVYSLALSGNTLYAGGTITKLGGQNSNRLGAVDITTGASTSWSTGADNTVRTLTTFGSNIFAGGIFQTSGVIARDRLACINMTTSEVTSFYALVGGPIYSLALSGGNLYVAGDFNQVNGQARGSIASISTSTGFLNSWNPTISSGGVINKVIVTGAGAYAGGTFSAIAGSTRSNFALLNLSLPVAESLALEPNGTVNAMWLDGTTLYLGGSFTSLASQPRNRMAAYNTSSGLTAFDPAPNSVVRDIRVVGSIAYAAGAFTTIGGQTRNRIAAVSTSSGNAQPWDPNASNTVIAIGSLGNMIYAGGDFTSVGGQTRPRVAAIRSDGTASLWNPSANAQVSAIATTTNSIFIGGSFTQINGSTVRGIAELSIGSPEINILPNLSAIFGNVDVVSGNPSLTFTLQNTGADNLTLSGFTITGANASDFSLSSPQTTGTVAPGASFQFTVSFNPSVLGVRNATLSIVSDDEDEGTTNISLSGSGVKANQTITFGSLPVKVYGNPTFSITASSTSGLGVSFSSSNTSVATISGNIVTIVGAGTSTIEATQAGNGLYNAAPPVDQTLTFNKANLTATAADRYKSYGDDNPSFTISYSGFVNSQTISAIDVLPTASSVASSSSNAGQYEITPSAGNDNNYAFTYVNGTLTINKITLSATADNKTREYGGANPSFTVSYSGFANGESSSVLDTPPTAACDAISTSAVGSYPIAASLGVDNNYDFTYVNGSLTIMKATLTVTAENKSRIYGASNPTFTVSYSGFANGESVSVLTNVPVASASASSSSPTGVYTIAASGGLDDNYDFSYSAGELTIIKAGITATAENKSRDYKSNNPAFTVSYSGFVNGDNEAEIDMIPVASTVATTGSVVGVYPISLTGGSDANYAFTLVPGSLTITKAQIAVTADNKARSYGELNPLFTITYSGLSSQDDPIDTPPVASSVATTTSNAGTYDITVSGGSDNNFEFTYQKGTLSIGKKPLTATADNKQRVYGSSNPEFTITYIGFADGDGPNSLDIPPSVVSTATNATPPGQSSITPSGGSDLNYSFIYASGTFTITKASQIITFANPSDKTAGDAPFDLAASASSGLTVSFTSSNSSVATISAATVTITGAGETVITASQAGNDNYEPATSVSGTLLVSFRTQTITFPEIGDKVMSNVNVTLAATASSSLGVSYKANTDNISLTGNTVTLLKAGTASITAMQTGNVTYSAAAPVTREFCINPAKPVITRSQSDTAPYLITSNAPDGNEWFLNNTPLNETGNSIVAKSSGSYKVRVKAGNCTSEFSNELAVVVTGVERNDEFSCYPNPVTQTMTIIGLSFPVKNLAMYDLQGRRTESLHTTTSDALHLNVTNLPFGIYILMIEDQREKRFVRFHKK
jgi:hypothetical protein